MKIRIREPSIFYSYLDEKNFFDWLHAVSGVSSVEREGFHLLINVPSKSISETDLRDLIAVFARYRVDMTDLKQFVNGEHEKWLNDPDAYWYTSLFD